MKKDNSTFRQKVALRRAILREIPDPIIMETHAGTGKLWQRCYSDFEQGIAFEKDDWRAEHLARQRPSWAVYEAEVVGALAAGAGAHLPVNFLDLDPYGVPWPALDAFFQSERPRCDPLAVVVTDGLRYKIKLGGAWVVGSLAGVVSWYGNDLYDSYLDVCRQMLKEKAVQVGYSLDRFTGYYTGHLKAMTHYAGIFTRAD